MAAIPQIAAGESLSEKLVSKELPRVLRQEDSRAQIWDVVQGLPYTLTVEVLVPNFTIGDLLRLEKDSIVETHWSQGMDVPLRANGEVMGWAEFEVMGDRLAVRLTDLE